MDINETPLPGVGIRYDFDTADGHKLAVVAHHTGRREIVKYEADDPDACSDVITLTDDESDSLAELLGAARLTGPLADLQQRIKGLAIDWVPVGSAFWNHPLADTQARTKTGASIVAVVRNEEAFPAPRPDFVFVEGDVLVVVGTPDGIRALDQILN